MALSSDLISQFVKVTKDQGQTKNETTAYGKIVKHGDVEYVQLDGSDLLTPISSTTVVKDGDRVMVSIKNHTAIVTGDLTSPSANNKDVVEIGNKITEFEIVIADKVVTQDLEAINAYIENIKGITAKYEELTVVTAEIETLQAKYANMEYITATDITAINAEIESIRGKFADFTNISAEDLEAVNAELTNLVAYNATFNYVSADKLEVIDANIKNLETNKLSTKEAEIKYANIDFSNIGEAAIENLFSDSGIIKDLIMSDGKVTGELIGVTIKGDLIEGNTVKADKLVIQGEDGLYYKLNVNALGETTASSDEKYQNGLDGSIIVAESITAEKIAVDDLVAFGATIGGYHITKDSLYSGVKNSVSNTTQGVFLSDDGQMAVGNANNYLKFFIDTDGVYKLELQADSIKFGSNNTTIEEYVNSNVQDIAKTVEGTELSINDGMKVSEFKIEGKSEQETRSGKNLLDLNKKPYREGSSALNGATVTIENGVLIVDATNATTAVTVRSLWMEHTHSSTILLKKGTYSTGLRLNLINSETLEAVQKDNTFTLDVDHYLTQWFFPAPVGKISTCVLQIESGDKQTEYEEYGVSPSPEYPSEIKSLGYENLYNANKCSFIGDHNSELLSRDTNEVEISSIGNWARTISSIMNLKPNTDYIISATVDKSKMSQDTASGFYSDDNYQSNGLLTPGTLKGDVYYKFTSNEYGNFPIQFYTNYTDNSVTGSVLYTNIQVTEKVIHPYIPYGKTGIEIINTGKNIYNYINFLANHNGLKSTLNEDGSITTVGIPTVNYSVICTNPITDILEDGETYSFSVRQPNPKLVFQLVTKEISTGTQTYSSASVLSSKNFIVDKSKYTYTLNIVTTTIESWGTESLTITNTYQLEKNSVATEFEKYHEPISTLLVLNEPLRSLSNGTKDIAYVKNGKLYVDRYIKSIILNGDENWIKNTLSSGRSRFVLFVNDGKPTQVVMCDHFKSAISSEYNYIFMGSSGEICLQYELSTVDEFKTWLSQNNMQIDYELETPVTEEMGITDIPMTENSTNIYYANDLLKTYLYCKYYTDYPDLWGIIEENNNSNTDTLNELVDGLNERINQSESTIELLSNMIANLVTDANGGSLMTQTPDGWTFNMSSISSNLDAIKDAMVNIKDDHNDTNSALEKLTNLVNDVVNKTAYITMSTDEHGAPCIELGKSDSLFKVRITNTAIDFLEGSAKIAYANNNTFYSEKIIVKNELQIGEGPGFVWRTRPNGNMGLIYISG